MAFTSADPCSDLASDSLFLSRRRQNGGRRPLSVGGIQFSFNSNFLILISHVRLLLTLLSLLLAMVAYQLLHCCYRHFRYFNLFELSEMYRCRFFLEILKRIAFVCVLQISITFRYSQRDFIYSLDQSTHWHTANVRLTQVSI